MELKGFVELSLLPERGARIKNKEMSCVIRMVCEPRPFINICDVDRNTNPECFTESRKQASCEVNW